MTEPTKAPNPSTEVEVRIMGLRTLPEIGAGDDLATLIVEAAAREEIGLLDGDVAVVTQKIVSKAEGRLVNLKTVEPSLFAQRFAQQWDKDPRLVEVVLQESRRIVRMDQGVLIAETHHGFVCANAGVDHSNLPGGDFVSLLPLDPDASAARLQRALTEHAGVQTAVLITDSFGRPWRVGTTEVAIGVAGMDPLQDYRGQRDSYGYLLRTTEVALADELASAAGLVMAKLSRVPVAIVRGVAYSLGKGSGQGLVRSKERDLFR